MLPLSDRELLQRFAEQRAESAFATLVRRHGPMVLRLCQRLLRNEHDAEDVCQATFLVLASKAASRYWQPSVASWLYRVAYHLARKAKASAVRRAIHERHASERPTPDPLETITARELLAVLDEELTRLPEKYRAPLVLCYLEGVTRDQAALQLSWPLGTLKHRMERGREMLRLRLEERGMALTAALSATGLLDESAGAPLCAGLCERVTQGALSFTGIRSLTAETASALAAGLAESALRTMALTKLKVTAAILLAISVFVGGVGAVAYHGLAGERATVQDEQALKQLGEERARAKTDTEKPGLTDLYGDPLPPGALVRMGTVQLRHEVASAAVSPDGNVLATHDDKSLRLWSMATGKLLLQIKDRFDWCPPMFSPDGRWLAVTRHGALDLLEATTGKRIRQIPETTHLLAFSPDSKLVATHTKEAPFAWSVGVWHTETGQQAFSLRGQEQNFWNARFTSDGSTLVTLASSRQQRFDQILSHWDVATGMLRKTVVLQLPLPGSLCLSADAQTLAYAHRRSKTIALWDTTTGKQRATLEGDPAEERQFAFTRDSRTLAIASFADNALEGTISVWDAATGKRRGSFPVPHRYMISMEFAPDGRTLLTNSEGPRLYLWDTTTGQPRWQRPAHDGGLLSLSFTPDGRNLVSGSNDGSIRVWATATGNQLRALQGHSLGVHSVAVLPDGQKVLSGGHDAVIRLQDLQTGKQVRRLLVDSELEGLPRPAYRVSHLRLVADGRRVVAFAYRSQEGPNPRLTQLWDLSTGQTLVRRGNQSAIHFDSFSPDGKIMAGFVDTCEPVDSDYVVAVLEEVATGREIVRISQPYAGRGHPVVFSPDGQTCVTMTSRYQREDDDSPYEVDRHTIHMWEMATGKERLTITNNELGEGFVYVEFAFAPDGRTFATARQDHTIQLWDVATGQELLRRPGYDVSIARQAFVFAPDGRTLATGHTDSTILIWDLAPQTWRRPPSSRPLAAKELDAAWADLASPDARKAHVAIWKLAAAPRQAVSFLSERLRPAATVPPEQFQYLLADLNSNRFGLREGASKQLTDLEEQAEPALQEALQGKPSAEQRRRIESLLAGPRVVRSPEKLRGLRAIQVLEQCHLPEARQVLEMLAKGASEARLTQDAKGALTRLSGRTDPSR
jgi:RNA polymerase sigma factor (sigma-70 family)